MRSLPAVVSRRSPKESATPPELPPVLVGVAGWSYPDWEDVVYPRAERDKLAYVARYFDCVEINSTFYHPCKPSAAEKWLDSVADCPRFRFAAKLWQKFTHETKEEISPQDVGVVKAGLEPLRQSGRLVALLAQFPFFFRDAPENRELLARIAGEFAEYPRVLEVRDVSWSAPEALDFIREQGYNVACLDMPEYKRAFHPEALVTRGIGYLRLHGRNRDAWFKKDAGRDEKYNYLYTETELEEILERLRKLSPTADQTVCIWNNHPTGQAAVNALQTLHKLLKKKVKAPPTLKRRFPQLDAITEPEGGSMFG